MAAKTTSTGQYAEGLLKLIFQGVAYSSFADNHGSGPYTSLYISLHSASPGASGNQTTNEISTGSYARQPITRDSSGFTVTANSVSPAATVVFPSTTSGTVTVTHFGCGTDVSGAGSLLYFGTVSPNINLSAGTQAELSTSTAITET